MEGIALYAQAGWTCNPLLNESLKTAGLMD
jgi:hypothetical protein